MAPARRPAAHTLLSDATSLLESWTAPDSVADPDRLAALGAAALTGR